MRRALVRGFVKPGEPFDPEHAYVRCVGCEDCKPEAYP